MPPLQQSADPATQGDLGAFRPVSQSRGGESFSPVAQPWGGTPAALPLPAAGENEVLRGSGGIPARPVSLSASQPNSKLGILRIALCQEVRGYDDLVECHRSTMVAGQPFLVYAALENFRSKSTANGFQTLTLSSLEVISRSGNLVSRQALGTAADLADAPRSHYFLTHTMKVPESLAPGDYVLQLNVYDLNSKQACQSQIAIRVR